MANVEAQIQEFVLAVLAAEKARLEADLVEAVRLQDPEMVDRLHVVSVAKPWGAEREFWSRLQSPNYRSFEVIVADEVGWAASFVRRPVADETDPGVERAARALQDRYANWTWSLDRWREIARLVLAEAADAGEPPQVGTDPPYYDADGDPSCWLCWCRRAESLLHGALPVLRYQAGEGNASAVEVLAAIDVFLAGEVETPCATCGGTREIGFFSGLRHQVGDWKTKPCPDCGVETPEAAVEAVARALRQELIDRHPEIPQADRAQTENMPYWREKATVAIAALRAAGWTPPGTEARVAKLEAALRSIERDTVSSDLWLRQKAHDALREQDG